VEVAKKFLLPVAMATAAVPGIGVSVPAYQIYLDGVLADAGDPTDPVEILMIQHLVFASLRVAELHARAGTAQGLELPKMYNAAATRLLAEFRKLAGDLEAYRTSREARCRARRKRRGEGPAAEKGGGQEPVACPESRPARQPETRAGGQPADAPAETPPRKGRPRRAGR
jgi:hypothetical protein